MLKRNDFKRGIDPKPETYAPLRPQWNLESKRETEKQASDFGGDINIVRVWIKDRRGAQGQQEMA